MRTKASARSLVGSSSLLLLLAVSACGKGNPRVASDLEAEIPTELRADYLSFTDNCSKCHQLERALTANVTDVRHWDLYVARMMRTAGSAISESERPKILRFLYWYTQRKVRLAHESNEPVKEYAPPAAEPSSGAQQPVVPAQPPAVAPTGDVTGEGAQDLERTNDANALPAQGKPGETAP